MGPSDDDDDDIESDDDGSVGDNQKAFGNRDHTDEECSRTLGGCIFASVY